jgi:hypothetical protein
MLYRVHLAMNEILTHNFSHECGKNRSVMCISVLSSDYHFDIFKLFVSGAIEQIKYINARLVSRSHEQLNTQMYIWCSEP